MWPEGTNSAASFPSRPAASSCRRLTLGSSPNWSSPTGASAIARRIAADGRVTVSERRSIASVAGAYFAPRARSTIAAMYRVSEGPELARARRALARRSVAPGLTLASVGSVAWASAVGNRAVQRYARQRMLARLTPDEILEQYQVDEDTMADWSPKAWGKVP